VQIRGTTDEYADIANLVVDAGRFMTPIEVELDEPVVVIGSEIKTTLFRGSDPVGQHLNVHSNRFRVIGVLKERGKSFGQSQDNVVIVPLTRFQRMFGLKRGLVIAAMAAPEHLKVAEEQIIEVLRRSRHLSAADEENFAVNRQEALMKMFESQTAMLYLVAFAVAAITLLVGGIGVMNIMLVTVTERTREVGVRRALGARRNTILAQFLVESTFVTMLGGILGVVVGIGLAYVINLISPVPAVTSPVVAAIGVLFSAVVGLVFGTWPAYRAAQLDPIESLRYE
jgi:putative ABC transport system permease protein